MDLRTPSDQVSSIGRGQYNPGIKYLGLYYITATSSGGSGKSGRHAHSTAQCKFHLTSKEYQRIPVFEKDGEAFWVDRASKRHNDPTVKVEICTNCPPYLDSKWREQGACWNIPDPRAFETNKPKRYRGFIEDYCKNCPVVVDCFEYGANTRNTGVWGGVFLPVDDKRKDRTIEERREELGIS